MKSSPASIKDRKMHSHKGKGLLSLSYWREHCGAAKGINKGKRRIPRKGKTPENSKGSGGAFRKLLLWFGLFPGRGEPVTLLVRRQELSSLEKFPRPERGLGGVQIEDSLNRWARRCRKA
ncbi:hypothetical protein VNO80_21342 [Phaseolus coccineus]|uniref:Uncharacterized protein n=1 Tax=Phaseolus coccineus TaxID=3886 RepID=A0AAN9QT79_PHACN